MFVVCCFLQWHATQKKETSESSGNEIVEKNTVAGVKKPDTLKRVFVGYNQDTEYDIEYKNNKIEIIRKDQNGNLLHIEHVIVFEEETNTATVWTGVKDPNNLNEEECLVKITYDQDKRVTVVDLTEYQKHEITYTDENNASLKSTYEDLTPLEQNIKFSKDKIEISNKKDPEKTTEEYSCSEFGVAEFSGNESKTTYTYDENGNMTESTSEWRENINKILFTYEESAIEHPYQLLPTLILSTGSETDFVISLISVQNKVIG